MTITADDSDRIHRHIARLPNTAHSMLKLLVEFPQLTVEDWWQVFTTLPGWPTPTPEQRAKELRERFMRVEGHWRYRNDVPTYVQDEDSFQRYEERRQRLIKLRARFDANGPTRSP